MKYSFFTTKLTEKTQIDYMIAEIAHSGSLFCSFPMEIYPQGP